MGGIRCCNIGDSGRRCRNKAERLVKVHQAYDLPRYGSCGWFEVALCHKCFFKSESCAITSANSWRWIK